ncbi:MAG: hypothetical protein JXM73_16475 [Anaerolineae bacterium]|nr:hypothetical protein [Anaerolineae bacterium]
MSKWLRILFLVHAVVAVIGGLPLLLAPGRTLDLFGWAPIDPLLSRILGAALLALAWSSWRGWRGATQAQAALLIEVEAIFTTLTCAGLLRQLLGASWPWYVWLLFGVFAAFAAAWVAALSEVVRTRER